MSRYVEINQAFWDDRAEAHAASPDYQFSRFARDPEHLSDVVRFDLPLLGSISGLRGVHLQCHIGTDTVSLHRLGATMTGLDFSSASLEQARRLAAGAGAAVDFVEAEVYAAVDVLGGESFDLVFTGIGALCWLPDINRWASVVSDLLRPGGRLFLREGHPIMWSLAEERDDDLLVLQYPYFSQPEPLVWNESGSYVSTDVEFAHNTSLDYSHGLGEIVQAILDAGLRLTGLVEHRSVPWTALPQMVRGDDGEWRLPYGAERVPLTYTLQAIKPQRAE